MLNVVFPLRFFKMELIRKGTPPTPHQHRQRTCDAARNGSKRKKRRRACFSSHCGTSRDEKCAAHAGLRTVSGQLENLDKMQVPRQSSTDRTFHLVKNMSPTIPGFQLLEKLISGTWRTSLPHLRPRFVYEPFSLRGDVERLLTPFLQMWMFGVVPTCTFSMCIIQSRDGSKLSEMLIAPHAVLAP